MGFLNLLKKKKSELDESLDIPPVPPPGLSKEEKRILESDISEEEFPPKIEKIKEKIPEIKEAGRFIPEKQEKIIDLPPLPEIKEMAEFPTPTKEEVKEEVPEIWGVSEHARESSIYGKPKLTEDFIVKSESRPVYPSETQKIEEKQEVKKEKAVKPLFLDIDGFKDVLSDINNTKTNLRDFEDILSGLDWGKKEKDVLYEKWRYNLNDIQKKIRFIDQTLFKG